MKTLLFVFLLLFSTSVFAQQSRDIPENPPQPQFYVISQCDTPEIWIIFDPVYGRLVIFRHEMMGKDPEFDEAVRTMAFYAQVAGKEIKQIPFKEGDRCL